MHVAICTVHDFPELSLTTMHVKLGFRTHTHTCHTFEAMSYFVSIGVYKFGMLPGNIIF